MKKILTFLILAAIPLTVCGQFNPPPAGAFTYSGSSWVAAVTTATGGALGFTPPPAALYCYNSTSGQWVPFDASCQVGGAGVYLPLSGGDLSGPVSGTKILTSSSPVFNVMSPTYGAKGDEREVADAAMTAGSFTITSASANFTPSDTGKTVTVNAGAQEIVSGTWVSGGTITNPYANAVCAVTGITDGLGGSGAAGYVRMNASGVLNTLYASASGSGYSSTTVTGTLSTVPGPGGSTGATCSGTATFTVTQWYRVPIVGTMTYVNSSTATLSVAATTTVSGALALIGTDDTGAINAAILAAYNAGGGNVYFPVGKYLILGQILMPNDGGSIPSQVAIGLTGDGSFWNGRWTSSPLSGVSELDLRYSVAPAKIDTRGTGILRMQHIVLEDNGDDTNPFVQTTNTTLLSDDNACIGSGPAQYGAGRLAQQDCFVLGGTTTSSNGASTAAFQGYGTDIKHTYFSKISRGLYGRVYADATVFSENTFSYDCGGQTAIEYDGTTGEAQNNVFHGNLIEEGGYVYAVTFRNSPQNIGSDNTFWDNGPFFMATITTVGASDGNSCIGCTGVSYAGLGYPPWYDQAGTNSLTYSDGVNSWSSKLKVIDNFGAPNDTLTELLRTSAGADATLGSLDFSIRSNPSATDANRYVELWASDRALNLPIHFDHSAFVLGPGSSATFNGQTTFGSTDLRLTGLGQYNLACGMNAQGQIGPCESVAIQGNSDLPASTIGNVFIAGGYGAGVQGRIFVGDGTGWQLKFSARTGGVTTDVAAMDDSGNFYAGNGSNILYRCVTAGTLPVGATTITAADCGSTADTGLRVK